MAKAGLLLPPVFWLYLLLWWLESSELEPPTVEITMLWPFSLGLNITAGVPEDSGPPFCLPMLASWMEMVIEGFLFCCCWLEDT